MTKRIIGLVLALCLIVGLLPMIALAEDEAEITSTLTVTTGTNDAKTQWKPTLSAGMTPAYAKTTAEGALVLDGASESDYTLKAEWPVDGKPTLTMNGATLANETETASSYTDIPTIQIGGTEDFKIAVKGTNAIKGNHVKASTTTAGYRLAAGIEAKNNGTLTIFSENKAAGSLLIDNYGGYGINNYYNALTFENTTFDLQMHNTGSNAQHGIIMAYGSDKDLTNLTVIGSNFNIDGGKHHSNNLILMGNSELTYKSDNTGDILFKNSKIRLYRSNSSGTATDGCEVVRAGSGVTVTIDRCDTTIYGRHLTFNYAPTILNATATTKGDPAKDYPEVEYALTPGAAISGKSVNTLKTTHICGTATDDFDCTTPNTCDMCGVTLGGAAQSGHTPAADDGDCTTEVKCANTGCNKVAIPAQTAHTPAADDGDCTTAIKCVICGTETTPAAAAHTAPADRTSCDQAADCTVCGTEIPAGQHSGGTATCQAKAKCSACGQEYGELAACAGGTATCTKKAECATCGKEYGETAPHTEGTPATCKDKAVCSVCNQAYGELSTTHVPEEDDKDCTTAVKCSLCGGEAIAAKTHAFTNSQDTACDNIGCEHTRVVEPKPVFKFSYVSSGGNAPSSKGKATLEMNAGDPAKYFTTGQYDTTLPNNWYMKETTDTTNWNVKIEYPADGIPTMTLKGAKVQNRAGLEFGGWDAPYEGPTKVIIEGDSLIMNTVAYNGSNPQRSAMNFNTLGDNDDVTITSVNGAKLTIATNVNGPTRGGISTTGNLILDNANIEIMTSEYNSVSHGIAVIGGNLTIKGGSLKITGYDDAKTTHAPGKDTGYTRNVSAMYSGLIATKDAANEAKAGNITIEGNAKVSIAVSVKKSTSPENNSQAIYQDGTFTIKNSEVEIGLVGKCDESAKIFLAKPVLEFEGGAYTVTATKTKKPSVTVTTFTEANDSTYSVVMAPDLSKAVNWAETTSLGSITYFKVVAGGSGAGTGGNTGSGTGTGTGTNTPSNPNTGDVSILLTAAIALSSAVGFAGVTVLRKKEF